MICAPAHPVNRFSNVVVGAFYGDPSYRLQRNCRVPNPELANYAGMKFSAQRLALDTLLENWLSASPFKSKNRLAAENAALRHQLIVLQRRVRGRVQLTNGDRLFLVMLYRWFPSILKAHLLLL